MIRSRGAKWFLGIIRAGTYVRRDVPTHSRLKQDLSVYKEFLYSLNKDQLVSEYQQMFDSKPKTQNHLADVILAKISKFPNVVTSKAIAIKDRKKTPTKVSTLQTISVGGKNGLREGKSAKTYQGAQEKPVEEREALGYRKTQLGIIPKSELAYLQPQSYQLSTKVALRTFLRELDFKKGSPCLSYVDLKVAKPQLLYEIERCSTDLVTARRLARFIKMTTRSLESKIVGLQLSTQLDQIYEAFTYFLQSFKILMSENKIRQWTNILYELDCSVYPGVKSFTNAVLSKKIELRGQMQTMSITSRHNPDDIDSIINLCKSMCLFRNLSLPNHLTQWWALRLRDFGDLTHLAPQMIRGVLQFLIRRCNKEYIRLVSHKTLRESSLGDQVVILSYLKQCRPDPQRNRLLLICCEQVILNILRSFQMLNGGPGKKHRLQKILNQVLNARQSLDLDLGLDSRFDRQKFIRSHEVLKQIVRE